MIRARRITQRPAAEDEHKPASNELHPEIRLIPIALADDIKPGDSIAEKLLQSLRQKEIEFEPGDILVVKHKIVSKAEGRMVDLATIKSSASAAWAKKYKLDARVIQLALRESRSVIRRKNAARELHRELKKRTALSIPVLITDSFGRPWREGLVDFCIGIAGMKALRDDRGRRDPHGYKLQASLEAVADELAGAAALVCGKLNRTPACIIRGFPYQPARGRTRDLLRPAANDLFR